MVSKKASGLIFKWIENLPRSYTKWKMKQEWTKHLWVEAAKAVCNLSISRIGQTRYNKVIVSFCPHTKKMFQRPASLQTSNSGNSGVFFHTKEQADIFTFKTRGTKAQEQKHRFCMNTCSPLWQCAHGHRRIGKCKSVESGDDSCPATLHAKKGRGCLQPPPGRPNP